MSETGIDVRTQPSQYAIGDYLKQVNVGTYLQPNWIWVKCSEDEAEGIVTNPDDGAGMMHLLDMGHVELVEKRASKMCTQQVDIDSPVKDCPICGQPGGQHITRMHREAL